MQKFKVNLLLSLLIPFTLCACSGGGDSTEGIPFEASDERGTLLTTDCGVVLQGVLQNPVNSSDGAVASSGFSMGPNILSLNLPTGPAALRLQGIGESRLGISINDRINSMLSGGMTTFIADPLCKVGDLFVGQVILSSGLSLSEELIRQGLVNISPNDPCGGELLTSCYQALQDSAVAKSAGTILDFLWKPESDPKSRSAGNLVILVDPCNVTVKVNGDLLTSTGPSNGRCTTARSFSRSGCSYGNSVKVEVFDNATGAPYQFVDGSTAYNIPNGCNRLEYKL